MLIRNNKLLKQDKFKLEKDLQVFIENHIPDILGEEYEFVCTEFTVGDFRIDSLAFNKETKSFIIIEDKKVENKSLVDQGLTYLKLLRDRKADFILKYNEVKGTNYNINDIDISQSKVVFFSPYYNKYQIYSSDYQNIPFELYKVTRYEDDIVDIEKIEKTSKERMDNSIFSELLTTKDNKEEIKVYTEEEHIEKCTEKVKGIYYSLKDKILELGDIDLDIKKVYIAFKGVRNIVDLEIYKNFIQVNINMKKGTLDDPLNIMNCYVSDDGKVIGHHGNGDYYISVYNEDEIDKVIPFIKQSLEINKK